MELLLVIIAVLIIWLAIKILRENEEEKRNKAIANRIEEIIPTAEELWHKMLSQINNDFRLSRCNKCNDVNYEILQFNSDYTGLQLECKSCQKKSWFKRYNNDNSFYLDWRNQFLKIKDIDVFTTPNFIIVSEKKSIATNPVITELGEFDYKNQNNRHSIPKSIKQDVWQRDGGKCIECGSKEKLEYDHIIPISKGGANTVRNIQLLCENCNRTKSAKIE